MRPPQLPEFPWDSLAPFKQTARGHPAGIVDLSVGTPVDEVDASIRAALAAAAHIPGYPATHGTEELRSVAAAALARRFSVAVEPSAVLPSIGSKEVVAGLAGWLGVGPGETVVIPELAYPTYEVGARLVGADILRADSLTAIGPARPALLWLNSPANPTGQVLGVHHLRKVVDWARERGVIVASDECYLSLHWDAQPFSVLHREVSGGDHRGLLAVHSLSKTSNLAGYRAGFVTGDPALVARLLTVRKHAGLIVPRPVQQAMVAALGDDDHVAGQRERYRRRRAVLR
ncbi:MAG: succinyldiaminopimelate transaminase, partial [Sciscionella sp.]